MFERDLGKTETEAENKLRDSRYERRSPAKEDVREAHEVDLPVARNTECRPQNPDAPVFRTQVAKRAWLTLDVVGLYREATLQR